MSLPDRTLCWVEGPPWDRHCEPVAETVMRDSDEPCGFCDAEGTVELASTRTREVLHRYCSNPECERSKWL